jgi:hypothetical protein
MHQIRGCTLGNGGHAAFASILWSPPLIADPENNKTGNFQDCLAQVPCDVLLVFGKDDPWVSLRWFVTVLSLWINPIPSKLST